MKERNYLMGKMRHLKDEITVWENNIGFFADSKQSNALKQDFEKKINRAKRELELLKAKIKAIEEKLEEL
jgi:hypothetical protein